MIRRRDSAIPSPSDGDPHRGGHVLVIVERLAHPHQHDVGQPPRRLAGGAGPFAVGVAQRHELADDLGRREVARERLRAGVAEPAGERAADLRGEAGRTADFLQRRDIDALHLLRVAEAEQEFFRAVLAGLPRRERGPADREPLRQSRLQRPRDRGHRAKNRWRPGGRSSARAGARGTASRRSRQARRPAPRATAPPDRAARRAASRGGGAKRADFARMRLRSASANSADAGASAFIWPGRPSRSRRRRR